MDMIKEELTNEMREENVDDDGGAGSAPPVPQTHEMAYNPEHQSQLH